MHTPHGTGHPRTLWYKAHASCAKHREHWCSLCSMGGGTRRGPAKWAARWFLRTEHAQAGRKVWLVCGERVKYVLARRKAWQASRHFAWICYWQRKAQSTRATLIAQRVDEHEASSRHPTTMKWSAQPCPHRTCSGRAQRGVSTCSVGRGSARMEHTSITRRTQAKLVVKERTARRPRSAQPGARRACRDGGRLG